MQLLVSSLCLVLPSLAEGWGVVLTEAAAAGTPAIAYDIPGVREQASLVPSVILVRPRDIASLASRIMDLLNRPSVARRLGEAGRQAAFSLTWDASVKQVDELLKKLQVTLHSFRA